MKRIALPYYFIGKALVESKIYSRASLYDFNYKYSASKIKQLFVKTEAMNSFNYTSKTQTLIQPLL